MSAATFAARLQEGPPLLLDGGLATELERRGAALDDALWSARLLRDDLGLIAAVHRDYVAAGCDVVTTASYQASLAGFARIGVGTREAARLVQRSVELARASGARFVAGSVGPYGATLPGGAEYTGGYTLSPAELEEFHGWRLDALLRAGVSVIAAETLPLLDEAAALASLVERRGGALWLSFTCRDERSLGGGERVEDAARLAEQSPAVLAVGVNCTAPAFVEGVLTRLRSSTTKPLLAYPNRGEGWDPARRRYTPARAVVDLPHDVPAWLRAGARLVGGCCRTTPEDIRAVGVAVREAARSPSP